MSQAKPSLLARLFAGAPLQQAAEALQQQTQARAEAEAVLAAVNRSQAMIEFKLDGTILHANDNFLKTLGYQLDDIKGRHHSMFVEPAYAATSEYRAFWDTRVRHQNADFAFLAKPYPYESTTYVRLRRSFVVATL